jgi:hypothetical protein
MLRLLRGVHHYRCRLSPTLSVVVVVVMTMKMMMI